MEAQPLSLGEVRGDPEVEAVPLASCAVTLATGAVREIRGETEGEGDWLGEAEVVALAVADRETVG